MNSKLPLQTPNLTAQNIDKIAALFPNCITEMLDEEKSTHDHKVYKRGINFELLKQNGQYAKLFHLQASKYT